MIFNDFYFDDIESAINEGDNSREKLCGYLEVLFWHLIKYKYNKSKQTKSWVRTIKNSYTDIQRLKINHKYITNDILDRCYKNGYHRASIEDHNNINGAPNTRPLNWDSAFVTNINKIKEFLNTEFNKDSIYPFDLDEII